MMTEVRAITSLAHIKVKKKKKTDMNKWWYIRKCVQMLHEKPKLCNDVFGQAHYPTDNLIQYKTACWCLFIYLFYPQPEFESALMF